MSEKTSLSPAQIQYLKIGPKTGNCQSSKTMIKDALVQQHLKATQQSSSTVNLNRIPRLTYGQFEKSVTNFGLLLNKNFGNQTTLHQIQKFGSIAKTVNNIMLNQKDKPVYNQKKYALMKKLKDRSDNRTYIKTTFDYQGFKLHITLKSFNIQQSNGHKTMDGLPIPYIRFLVQHVNSSRLSKIIQGAIKNQGSLIVVQFDKIEGRASHFSNNEIKYQNISYKFDRLGQQLNIILPSLEISYPQAQFHQTIYLENKQILEIIQTNFDNVEDLINKYLDTQTLIKFINKHQNNYNHQTQIKEGLQKKQSQQQQRQQQEQGQRQKGLIEKNQQQQDIGFDIS